MKFVMCGLISMSCCTGGSAFAGYQPLSSSMNTAQPSTSQAPPHLHPKAEEEEGGSLQGDEDLQVNNRVAGGAGKRLSVEDLQVCFLLLSCA